MEIKIGNMLWFEIIDTHMHLWAAAATAAAVMCERDTNKHTHTMNSISKDIARVTAQAKSMLHDS